ncbi:MAG TPA: hypothetical protein RWO09_01380 [Ruminococcus sp.]
MNFQLSDEAKERIKKRNSIRGKIAAVCGILTVIGIIIVRIIC